MTYAAVHARPEGDSTVARLALTASEYGFDGVVVRNHGDSPASYDPETVADTYDVDVVTGVEIRADDPAKASGYLGTHRPKHDLVAVHGGDPAINRFAVDQPAVDVLAHPLAGDGDVNHVLARAAAENGVRLELGLRPVLHLTGDRRVRAIRSLRTLTDLIDTYDVPYVVSADPRSHLDLRDPRGLVALGETIGIGGDRVDAGLSEWGRLAERNRDRSRAGFVEPGVWRGRPDEDHPASGVDDEGDG